MIGQSISHYKIIRRLGVGGMGEVYEAEDTILHRRIAIKILPVNLATKPECLERFKREARAVAALNHPNIITIHSVDQVEETHFLTMELVEGRSLSALIPEGGFSLERLFSLSIPLMDAVAAAHSRNIAHRDIKPSNVMLGEHDRIKVIDFGLAKLLDDGLQPADADAATAHQTRVDQLLGTPAYMSPEQIECRNLDVRTDVFSLGILLFEMATACRPFKHGNSAKSMASILRDPPTSLRDLRPELPEHLERIIQRCLRKDPDDRYQTAREIRDELKLLHQEIKEPQALKAIPDPKHYTAKAGQSNLPVQLTRFIGRERETAELVRLIIDDPQSGSSGTRLLTLTGPGGTGKTRLALEVATRLTSHFPDGVWMVELAALSDPSLLAQTMTSSLGLITSPAQTPAEVLTHFLAQKRALLVMDNCEHLVADCAQIVESLLRSCAKLSIVVTSRESLRLTCETVWPVPSLSVPGPPDGKRTDGQVLALEEYESIKLFAARAEAVEPKFALGSHNIEAVAEICRRLDGIPLAIELAAARSRLLPADELLNRLRDRFHLLKGGSRASLPRQQTLRALVDWSYDLLSTGERLLFDRLSVFAGGFTLEAAEQVCGANDAGTKDPGEITMLPLRSEDIFELLENLQAKSMVMAERSPQGRTRYRLLETLRLYGTEQLTARGTPEVTNLRIRHSRWMLRFSAQAEAGIRGPDQLLWARRFETELDNIRAALEWGKVPGASIEHVESALLVAASLYVLWFRLGHGREGRQHLEILLSRRNADQPTRAQAKALWTAGSLALWQDSDDAAAWNFLSQSLKLARELGDRQMAADGLRNLGFIHFRRGEKAAARQHHEEAIRYSRETGDSYGVRWSLEDLADLTAAEGNPEQASRLYEEALSIAKK